MQASRQISVIGLGYVGLPVAVAFGQHSKVIGFDANPQRVADLNNGVDHTGEVLCHDLQQAEIEFTSDPDSLNQANFHIVAVPTPIDDAKQPDLSALLKASEAVARRLKPGDIVVYESTVYPGATEEECLPILESLSGLKCDQDFAIGYSPERINPGDKEHSFKNIAKVVAASNAEALATIAATYGLVIDAEIYQAKNIKVAEAAKVLENTQRDLNISLMNELALICKLMHIDCQDVIDAAQTKWNFLPFRPGLVGGHCIGVDPYYLTFKSKQLGYRPEVILAGRRINDGMGKHIAQETVKLLIHAGGAIKNARVGVLGLSFKENCPDIRNSKAVDLIQELTDYGVKVLVHDPLADPQMAARHYQIDLAQWEKLQELDALVIAVAHEEYRQIEFKELLAKLTGKKIIVDVKAVLDRQDCADNSVMLWRL